jgi:diacylglycerol kinase family enzyme
MDDSNEWQTLEGLTTLVLGHGQFWGGGLQILPGADPTDGLMDVVALQGLGLWDFISKGAVVGCVWVAIWHAEQYRA